MADYSNVIEVIRGLYGQEGVVPLHAPVFQGNEKKYLCDCVDSTFVSSVGEYVTRFEEMMAQYTGAKRAVAVVNGTNGLHLALRAVGVEPDTEVITQSLTFVATTNAIHYEKAHPVFVDVDCDTMGLSPQSLKRFLEGEAETRNGQCFNRQSGRRIGAILPMHTFGHPVRIEELADIAREWKIPLVEDAAESVGSFVNGIHTGLHGVCAVLSFNGNKTITTGGGGMIITNKTDLADKLKHLSTTAKVPHSWEFYHDAVGFNYRMPNINAALGCAQMERLSDILRNKRETAGFYSEALKNLSGIEFFSERAGTTANYWLNAVLLPDPESRDHFLQQTNAAGIQTRPIWVLQQKLPMNAHCQVFEDKNALWLEERVVNIPSGVRGS